ncbi:sulfatase family protein [Colwellia piezophila]|uniref:sulfatase family protein n=1 Tax=Colwellia piezophila TaxID=211668 RepID=UPI00035DC764|nr:arylsulfatase [Colwellia piezophila]
MQTLAKKIFLILTLSAGYITCSFANEQTQPNIIIFLADDLGYGEIQHLNPEHGKIPTPNLDALARSGLTFTDAHSASSVCTPTRYALLTGRYAWRTRLQKGVLTGGESLIAENRLTLAKMLKNQGYHTSMIGKWHLGMLFDGKHDKSADITVGTKVSEGPIDKGGFDEFLGFHHARQMNLLIKNQQVSEKITPVEMLPRLTQAAVAYIDSRKNNKQPFFLYIPWNSPHSPVKPSKAWLGKSGLNEHADFVMQTDDSTGQVIAALKRNNLLENTIIISSADNGTSEKTANAKALVAQGHYPSGNLRGYKSDSWDGGHRVPFFVSWPKVIPANSVSSQLISLNDIFSTLAELLKINLADINTEYINDENNATKSSTAKNSVADGNVAEGNVAEDSISFLPLLVKTKKNNIPQKKPLRQNIIHHSISGHFAIRQGPWKLILASGSGGWSKPKKVKGISAQLYNLDHDLGEQDNLARAMPEKVAELTALLQAQVAAGRSTPGIKQHNDVTVNIFKH